MKIVNSTSLILTDTNKDFSKLHFINWWRNHKITCKSR